jgi:hypothetical protein
MNYRRIILPALALCAAAMQLGPSAREDTAAASEPPAPLPEVPRWSNINPMVCHALQAPYAMRVGTKSRKPHQFKG